MATRRFTPRTKPPAQEVQGKRVIRASVGTKAHTLQETEKEEILLTERFEPGEEPAHVRFGAGVTINMGDFNSLRLDCAVTLPCRPEEIEQAFIKASDFVAEKIADERAIWLGTAQ